MTIFKHLSVLFIFSLMLGCGDNNNTSRSSISTQTDSAGMSGITTTNNGDPNGGTQTVSNTEGQPITTNNNTSKNMEVKAEDGAKTVELPDGSKIILNRGSRVNYTENEGMEEKNVTLKGEAYFEVKAAKNKKFNVYAGNTKTTVVGTSFNIRAYEHEDEVILDVVEGVVDFIEEGNVATKVGVLTKERAIYKKPRRSLQKETSKNDDYKWWLKTNTNDTTTSPKENTIKTPPVEELRTWKTDTYKCNTKLETNTIQGQKETKTFPLPFATGYSINFTALAGNIGAAIMSTDEQPERGDKIAFITEAKTQRSFAFTATMKTTTVAGQKRYTNVFILNKTELAWLANNTIKQIQIVKTVAGKTYMRRVDEEMQRLFAETVRCFLEGVE